MKAEPNFEDSLYLLSGEYTVQEDPVFYTQRNKGLRWAITGICSSIFAVIINLFLIVSSVLFFTGKSTPEFASMATSLTNAGFVALGISIALTVFAMVDKHIAKGSDISGDLTSVVRAMANVSLITIIVGFVLFLSSVLFYNWDAVVGTFSSVSTSLKAYFAL